MTDEEFKKAMTKLVWFIIIALIILVVVGVVVFNKSGRKTSLFSNDKEVEEYKKKVNETSSYNITEEDVEKLENNSEEVKEEEAPENSEQTQEQPNQEQPNPDQAQTDAQ